MLWSSLLSVIAASIGFVSGVWFCYGAAFISPHSIAQADDNSWKAEPDIAGALISQSAEYLAGGLLLIIAFALQVAAALVPTANVQVQYQELLLGWVVVPTTVLVSATFSYPIYLSRKTWLTSKVNAVRRIRANNPP